MDVFLSLYALCSLFIFGWVSSISKEKPKPGKYYYILASTVISPITLGVLLGELAEIYYKNNKGNESEKS